MDELKLTLENTNLKKKYLRLAELLHGDLTATHVISLQNTLLIDLFNGCFDPTLNSAVKLLEILLGKLLKEQPDLELWFSVWGQQYCDALKANKHVFHQNTSQGVNTMIAEVNLKALPFILNKIHLMDPEFKQKHFVWSFCSLFKIAKVKGIVRIDPGNDRLVAKDGTIIGVTQQTLRNWLFHSDRGIQQEILQAIVDTSKLAEPPTEFELQMALEFIRGGLRTSHPNFRKECLVQFKWLIERTRRCYEKDFFLIDAGRAPKKDLSLLSRYINLMLDDLYSQLFPDISFELANPVLEILKLIYEYLGNWRDVEIRKGFVLKPINYLSTLQCNAFSEARFEVLLTQMASSWESARILSYELLQLFPPTLPYFTKERLQSIYAQAIQLIGDPVIRWFEAGAYLLSWITENFAELLFPEAKSPKLGIMEDLYGRLEARYQMFRKVFASDTEQLQQNLIHGYICSFWVILKLNHLELIPHVTIYPFMGKLLDLLREIMEFATQLSADNYTTWILDDQTTISKVQAESNLQIDCRGHFYVKDEQQFIKHVGALLQGNTLIESLEGEGDNVAENILVVAFYLVTREAGQFFQQLSALIETYEKVSPVDDIVPTQALKSIVYQFFHALLNIKHMGSIDKIAHGLNQVAKIMCTTKRPQLPNLVHDVPNPFQKQLLDRLMAAFNSNQLNNIFRRSAGLPHIVACLLKALNVQQRKTTLPLIIKQLLAFARGETLELRVHALNILRKLFLETNLRQEMETYIGEGFRLSISNFAYDDWSVRNSALMLFSALSSRTISRHTNAEKLGARKNFVEFFAKAHELVQFFHQELDAFLSSTDVPIYPSLYPITLLLSRVFNLVPLDMRMQRTVDVEEEAKFFVKPSEVEAMLPKLVECARNKNYLGRLMVSKAILPFLQFQNVPGFACNMLTKIESYDWAIKHHNEVHGLLLICKQVMIDYYLIKAETSRYYEPLQLTSMECQERAFFLELMGHSYLATKVNCPPIQLTVYEILITLLRSASFGQPDMDLITFARQSVLQSFKEPTFRIKVDLSHSTLRKKQLSYLLKLDGIYSQQTSLGFHLGLLDLLTKKYHANPSLLQTDDLEILMFLLKQLNLIIKTNPSVISVHKQEIDHVIDGMVAILMLDQAKFPSLSLSINEFYRILLNLNSNGFALVPLDNLALLNQHLLKTFNSNSQVCKQVIKLSGIIMNNHPKPDLSFYLSLCQEYSNCEQIDDQRIAVIKSLTFCFERLVSRSQQELLPFYTIFLRFLQDEIPEVRQRISRFLSKAKLNFEYVFTNFFTQTLRPSTLPFEEAASFLCALIFASEFYLTKKMNHHQKKIFAYEKGNKFHNDYKIAEMAYLALVPLINQTTALILDKVLDQFSNRDFNTIPLEAVHRYDKDFIYRDEVNDHQ